MKKTKKTGLLFCVIALALASVNATATNVSDSKQNVVSPQVLSVDEESGVTIIRDAAGGIVVSGLPTPYVASLAAQRAQLQEIEEYRNSEDLQVAAYGSRASSKYYDKEENPIYIGTWDGVDCYARHTLGSYNSTTGYLTSYGDCSWYNTSGYNALPYRNGAATVEGQNVVDVAKGSYFDIRDMTTDEATTLKVNDWGPNQIIDEYGNDLRVRIADIDKNTFKELHGNTSDGVFYCRTYVPITNYNA